MLSTGWFQGKLTLLILLITDWFQEHILDPLSYEEFLHTILTEQDKNVYFNIKHT